VKQDALLWGVPRGQKSSFDGHKKVHGSANRLRAWHFEAASQGRSQEYGGIMIDNNDGNDNYNGTD